MNRGFVFAAGWHFSYIASPLQSCSVTLMYARHLACEHGSRMYVAPIKKRANKLDYGSQYKRQPLVIDSTPSGHLNLADAVKLAKDIRAQRQRYVGAPSKPYRADRLFNYFHSCKASN